MSRHAFRRPRRIAGVTTIADPKGASLAHLGHLPAGRSVQQNPTDEKGPS